MRAWRWLRSSGYYEDDDPVASGPEQERRARERYGKAVGAQLSSWWSMR